MSVLTRNVLALIQYLTARIPVWNANSAEIGLELSDVTAVSDAVSAMETAVDNADAARAASKAATLEKAQAFENMYDVASLMIKKIKAQADSVADPKSVYAAAQVDMPNPPSPRPAPPVPVEVTAVINQAGNVDVEWKGVFGQDAFFTIERQVTPANGTPSAWAMIGSVGEKKFTDTNLPANTYQALYRVRSNRNDKQSAESEPGAVQIGGGPTLQSGDESMPMAA